MHVMMPTGKRRMDGELRPVDDRRRSEWLAAVSRAGPTRQIGGRHTADDAIGTTVSGCDIAVTVAHRLLGLGR